MFLQAHNKAPDRQQSLWDATESPVVVEKRPRLPQKVVSCKKQAMYTVRDGKIVQLSAEHGSGVDKPASTAAEDSFSGQVFVALQPSVEKPQVCDRLTEEEIRKLPRFHNYKQGEVSKGLKIVFVDKLTIWRVGAENDIASCPGSSGHSQDGVQVSGTDGSPRPPTNVHSLQVICLAHRTTLGKSFTDEM
ncbi:hypothetical protein J6590_100563 [Homalodisca vitripennis]|nr:hypothetical protein J6590_100563 [Homalodisca vitripennis]